MATNVLKAGCKRGGITMKLLRGSCSTCQPFGLVFLDCARNLFFFAFGYHAVLCEAYNAVKIKYDLDSTWVVVLCVRDFTFLIRLRISGNL